MVTSNNPEGLQPTERVQPLEGRVTGKGRDFLRSQVRQIFERPRGTDVALEKLRFDVDNSTPEDLAEMEFQTAKDARAALEEEIKQQVA